MNEENQGEGQSGDKKSNKIPLLLEENFITCQRR